MVTAVVEDYHDDSDSEESIVSHNEEEDYFGIREQNPSQGSNWTYLVRSDRGGEAYSNLPKRKLPSGKFKLEINYADQMLLSDMKVEVPFTLSKIRSELHGSDQGQEIGPAEALCAEIPRRALEHFHGYLKSGLASNEEASWSFQDIITFLRGEIRMRLYNCSALELCDFGFSTNDFTRFERVRKALTKADRPASERDDSMPAYSFDPLIRKIIDSCNENWRDIHFVKGTSKLDVDDDKVPNTSPKWADHGMRRTPTKDKKLKPVNHLQATTAGGYITMMIPDTLNLQMKDMLKESIDHLVPPGPGSEAVRSALVFFIDRGYLEIAKYQEGEVKNLIQIMSSMGIKFLGTIKDSASFPFEVVDIKTDEETVRNGRPVVQAALHQAVSSVCQASEKPQIRIQVEVSRKGRLVGNVLLRHPNVGKKMKIINLMHWQRPLHWRWPQMWVHLLCLTSNYFAQD